jgi:hypothetical protein
MLTSGVDSSYFITLMEESAIVFVISLDIESIH